MLMSDAREEMAGQLIDLPEGYESIPELREQLSRIQEPTLIV
jgi:hypothetical protein